MLIKKCIADVDICNIISTDVRYVTDVDIRNLFFFFSYLIFLVWFMIHLIQ